MIHHKRHNMYELIDCKAVWVDNLHYIRMVHSGIQMLRYMDLRHMVLEGIDT